MRVLAVCAGNICRSPTAEAAIRSLGADVGLDLEVDSAGTGSWNVGDPPTPQAIAAAARIGLAVQGRARKVNSLDFERFDVIVVMDRSNLRDVLAMAPDRESEAKVRLFRTYDHDTDEDEIPDPYGGPDEAYDRALTQIMGSARGLVESLSSPPVEESVPVE